MSKTSRRAWARTWVRACAEIIRAEGFHGAVFVADFNDPDNQIEGGATLPEGMSVVEALRLVLDDIERGGAGRIIRRKVDA